MSRSYIVIQSSEQSDFEAQVDNAIRAGYIPQGGIHTIFFQGPPERPYCYVFFQSMVYAPHLDALKKARKDQEKAAKKSQGR